MFKKKNKADITPGQPQFSVRYVGRIQVYTASGQGCTNAPVQKIWDGSEEERCLGRATILVNPIGITMKEIDNKKKETVFDIKQITYCCAERGVHDRVFAWIYKDPASTRMDCHAVLCSHKEKAQTIAVLVSRAFQIAYKDWKTEKQKEVKAQNSSKATRKSAANSLNVSCNSSLNGADNDLECGSTNATSNGSDNNPCLPPGDTLETQMSELNITTQDDVESVIENDKVNGSETDIEHGYFGENGGLVKW